MSGLETLIRDKRILMVLGPGGVGKTTVSASLALHLARMGKRVLVCTIDPARRLADSLGIPTLGNEETRIGLPDAEGELWAMMLDPKQTLDRLVRQHAQDEESYRRICTNKFYKHFSQAMSGTHEQMAAEQLHTLYESGKYDCIVLDTPPTMHALDFLDAPERMIHMADESVYDKLIAPYLEGKVGLLGKVRQYILRVLIRFVGQELIDDLGTFLGSIHTMFSGFRERALHVQQLFADKETMFLVISGVQHNTIDEALHLRGALANRELPFGGFIVNRVMRAEPSDLTPERIVASLQGLDLQENQVHALSRSLQENHRRYVELARQHAVQVRILESVSEPSPPVFTLPHYHHEIYDLPGLQLLSEALFAVSSNA